MEMDPRSVITTVANYAFLVYVCGLSYSSGCSTQIILGDKVLNRRKNGKFFRN